MGNLLRKFVQLMQTFAPSSKKPPPFLPCDPQHPPIVESCPSRAGLIEQPSKHCTGPVSLAQANNTTTIITTTATCNYATLSYYNLLARGTHKMMKKLLLSVYKSMLLAV